MSLTSVAESEPVRQLLAPLVGAVPKRATLPRLRVAPRTRNFSLVGTAFDYLFRFEVARRCPDAVARPWVAEAAYDKMESGWVRVEPGLLAEARGIIDAARRAVRLYRRSAAPARAEMERVCDGFPATQHRSSRFRSSLRLPLELALHRAGIRGCTGTVRPARDAVERSVGPWAPRPTSRGWRSATRPRPGSSSGWWLTRPRRTGRAWSGRSPRLPDGAGGPGASRRPSRKGRAGAEAGPPVHGEVLPSCTAWRACGPF